MTINRNTIQRLFSGIVPHYDLINSILTFGQHLYWKSLVAQISQTPTSGIALDVCAGTADIAIAIAHRGGCAVALDFSSPMLSRGRQKAKGLPVGFVQADALSLPFADNTFDAATVGFSLRNVESVPKLLTEMVRVVRPGGWVVSLETSQPPLWLVRVIRRAYLELIVTLTPLLSDGCAYRHLLHTIIVFPGPEQVAELFREAGLIDVDFMLPLFGVVAIHFGRVS